MRSPDPRARESARRRRRRDPAPARLLVVRAPVHHLRAPRAPAARGGQARRRAPALRPREAARGAAALDPQAPARDHADVEALVDRVEREVDARRRRARRERIGELCLEGLAELDRGAYLQFLGTLPAAAENADFAESARDRFRPVGARRVHRYPLKRAECRGSLGEEESEDVGNRRKHRKSGADGADRRAPPHDPRSAPLRRGRVGASRRGHRRSRRTRRSSSAGSSSRSRWSQNATNIVAQKYFRGQLGSAGARELGQADDRPRRRDDRRLGPRRRLLRHRRGRRRLRGRAHPHPAAPEGRLQQPGLVQRRLRGAPAVLGLLHPLASRTRWSRSSTGTPRRG